MIICSRCEKQFDEKHECARISRRHFFGALLGACVAAKTEPKLWAALPDPFALNKRPLYLNRGDHLRVRFGAGIDMSVGLALEAVETGEKRLLAVVPALSDQQIYIAPERMRVTGVQFVTANAGPLASIVIVRDLF